MGRLDKLDLDKEIESKKEYEKKLEELQLNFLLYQRVLIEKQRNVILVFEGPDAAGKGGVIKRVTEKLDPRFVKVYSVVKPTSEEYKHHYMWRFWNKLPPLGELAIFDRSWYGRVLVERIEKFATKEEWGRAFQEINEFERALTNSGTILMKFYVHISKTEQLRRFKKREGDPYKRWKMTDEDWRNREKWSQNIEAADEMFDLTDGEAAPWYLIEGEHKWYARLKTLKIINERFLKEFGKL